MPVRTLDHVNIRTDKLAETYAFYADLLGLELTRSPGSKDLATGAWLCDHARRPVVHVASIRADYGDGGEGEPASHGSGAVHHVAFDCSDYDDMSARLIRGGCTMRTSEVAAIGLRQIFVVDPNGITVELNFWPPRD